jgi:hypothetical protein
MYVFVHWPMSKVTNRFPFLICVNYCLELPATSPKLISYGKFSSKSPIIEWEWNTFDSFEGNICMDRYMWSIHGFRTGGAIVFWAVTQCSLVDINCQRLGRTYCLRSKVKKVKTQNRNIYCRYKFVVVVNMSFIANCFPFTLKRAIKYLFPLPWTFWRFQNQIPRKF